MNYCDPQVVFQEVPGHISLALSVTGCRLGCKGCHSVHTWDPTSGALLSDGVFTQWLDKYQGMISNVLFYGGEWEPERLTVLLKMAKARGLATTLYTGAELDELSPCILEALTFVKTGRYQSDLGGLRSAQTNQRFYDVEKMIDLTWVFSDPTHHVHKEST